MYSNTLLAALLPALAAAIPVTERTTSQEIKVTTSSYAGSGCPYGSATYMVGEDGSYFTYAFSSFIAQIGPGHDLADTTKECELLLTLEYPEGLQFAILDVTFSGYAIMPPPVSSNILDTFYFDNSPIGNDYLGPKLGMGATYAGGGNFTVGSNYNDYEQANVTLFSPCVSPSILHVTHQISMFSADPEASGMIADYDGDGALINSVSLAWQNC